MHDPIATKLSAARTRLILDKPFLGALVLRLPMVEADPAWCRSTATDARTFYYNREFIEVLSLDHVQFMLAHEALHCALAHFARRQHRVKHRWDVACDHAINPILVEDGLRPPPGILLLDEFKDMTAEEIYPYIKDDTDEETLDQHAYDDAEGGQRGNQNNPNPPPHQQQGSGASADKNNTGGPSPQAEQNPGHGGAPQPPPLSSTERDTLAVQWQQRLAGAAQQAMQAGKLGGALARLVDHLLQPQLPWRMLLARYLTSIARDDYSYMRPSRREGNAILPSLRSHHLELTVVLDTSGSITEAELNEFLAEVNAIKGQMQARITLHTCDTELAADGPWQVEAWEELKLPRAFQGGGGTSFVPPFIWAERQDRQPDLLVYFTDAQGEFPAQEPVYPVLWLVKGRSPVPWGQRVQLN
ncbi:MAG TPA: VWA-like domain-containing protein [Acidiferrobacterales bacterium]|nr:VWA-like domain-containing protein [Acidiferrobacterales bacterium]